MLMPTVDVGKKLKSDLMIATATIRLSMNY